MPVSRIITSVLVGLLFAGVAFGQQELDVYRLQLFSSPESRVVAVGEEFRFVVQGVAVAEDDEAGQRLVHALQRIAFSAEVNADFHVVEAAPPIIRRRAETDVLEFSRRFTLRARHPGRLTIPAVVVSLGDGAEARTRPLSVLAYKETTGLINARENVVSVVAEGRIGRQELRRIGSGFLVGIEALVTAYHVILGADRIRIQLPDGRRITTDKVWAIDPVRDVAILYVDPESVQRAGLSPLSLSPDLSVGFQAIGEGVAFTAGWPNGIQQPTAGERYRSLRFETGDLLGVSSNAVRPGDSGGPLLNVQGEVIGVVSSGRSTNRERDVLREDLCLASDMRRALAVRIVREEPVSLRDALREAARDAPNGEVLHAASMLMMPGQAGRNAGEHLAQIAAAAQRAPNDAALQFLAGSVFQAVGDDERAEASYLAALNGLSDYFPALYALGNMHYQRGEYEQAEELFERTRSFAPYARLGALGLARVYTARLQYADAAEALAVVLGHNPDYAPALYLLGYGHLAQGRIPEAEAIGFRLDRIDSGWADALRLHISVPLLHPAIVRPLPRAEILANSED